jgi:gas vesicle protein
MIRQASLSHGDFSKTIETPANQLRILSERLMTLGRTIGTMFIPIINKVLPWINALVIGLTRLARILAKLFGYKGESPIKNMKNDFAGGADGADDLAGSVGGAGKQVDKLKKKMQALAGFDELNILGSKQPDPVDSGAGGGADLGGAFEIDLEGYDNLFDEIKQKSEELVDDIITKFNSIYEPLAESIGKLKGAFSRLGAVTFRNLENLWNTFFKPLAEWAMSTVLKDIIDGLTWMADVLYDVGVMLEGINYTPMVEGIMALWEAIKPFAEKIGQGLEYLLKNVLVPLAIWAVETLAPKVFETLTRVFESLTRILEVLTPLFKWFVDDVLIPLGQWTGKQVIKALDSLASGFERVADFAEKHPTLFENIIIILGSFATAVGLVIGAYKLLKVASVVWKVLGAIVSTGVIPVILIIAGLIAVGVLLYKNWDTIKEKASELSTKVVDSWNSMNEKLNTFTENIENNVKDMWENVKEGLKGFWEEVKRMGTMDGLKEDWAKVGDMIKTKFIEPVKKYFEDLKTKTSENWEKIKQDTSDKWDEIKTKTVEKVKSMIESIQKFFEELPEKIGIAIGRVLGTLATWAVNVIGWIVTEVPKIVNKIVDFMAELPSKIKEKIDKFKDTIATWVKNSIGWATTEVPKFVAKVVDLVKDTAKKMGEKLDLFKETIVTWIKNAIGWVKTEVPKFVNSIIEIAKEIPDKIRDKLNLFKNTIATWVSDSIGWVRTEFPKLLNNIVDWFAKLPNAMVDIGANMIKGLWNGILSVGSWLTNKMSGYFGKLWEVASDLFGGIGKGFRETFVKPQRFARGGMPQMGSLFVAGESGAELIGSHRGSSTVMPLEDSGFVEAMSKAVYSAVVSANGGGNDNGIIIQIGERTILDTLASGVNRDTRINGKSVIRV